MLDTALLFGVVPERHGLSGEPVDLAAYFRLARGGRDARGAEVTALEMTKWFDTNYHYLVPEFAAGQTFRLDPGRLLGQVREAVTAGFAPKVVLPGPLTFLTLGKAPDGVDRLDLLPGLLDAYAALLALLARECPWIELDEPILVQDLPRDVAHAFPDTYRRLVAAAAPAKVLLATYFGSIAHNLDCVAGVPLAALHVDLVRAPEQLALVAKALAPETALSLGLVDGRNIWRVDAAAALARIDLAAQHLGSDRLLLAPSCSLLHCPIDLAAETDLDPELRSWMAFAAQKCREVRLLADAAAPGGPDRPDVAEALAANRRAWESRRQSPRTQVAAVRARLAAITPAMFNRATPYPERARRQHAALGLPALPTTTIGSFPQTAEIRSARRRFKSGELSTDAYDAFLKTTMPTPSPAGALGLDVLVHGEPSATTWWNISASAYGFASHETAGCKATVRVASSHRPVRRRVPSAP
jgi:5-methyltetrahydropteroyltriglutamate--homocysteine methyltransferase